MALAALALVVFGANDSYTLQLYGTVVVKIEISCTKRRDVQPSPAQTSAIVRLTETTLNYPKTAANL